MTRNPDSGPDVAWSTLWEIIDTAWQANRLADYVEEICRRLPRGVGEWTIVVSDDGDWSVLSGTEHGLPSPESLSDILDQAPHVVVTSGRRGCSVGPDHLPLVVLGPFEVTEADYQKVASVIRIGIRLVDTVAALRQRNDRLASILQIVRRWTEHREMGELLRDLAESAAAMMEAERASIFLWDRPRKQLVARPALGVPGGELRVADDLGVVGRVVQTGIPLRVDESENAQVNRAVDDQLKFRTRNLVCVPLHNSRGKCLGAFELLNKHKGDFTEVDVATLGEISHYATAALETAQDRERLFQSRQQIAQEAASQVRLIGDSRSMVALRQTVDKVADTDLSLLILGENGTGKEVVSRTIHYLSPRRDEPFIAVNCAAIAETLLESELFGHEKGAFTDAHEARAGKFELASGGTLFLDEIGDMSLGGQAKLLRVLEEKVVVRVGGSQAIPSDARVIAATNQDLGELVRNERFREDLFFRLNVVTLKIPPLRERVDDIELLAQHFLGEFSRQAKRESPRFTPPALKRLRQHAWPGNVRELRNMMERLAYLSTSQLVDVEDLDFIAGPRTDGTDAISLELGLAEATRAFQVSYIDRQIEVTRGNVSEAAERLGMHRSNLYRKMRQLGMDRDDANDETD